MIKGELNQKLEELINSVYFNKPDAAGGSSEVYYVKQSPLDKRQRPHSALLKRKIEDENPVSVAREYIKDFNEKKERCENLANKNISVAMPKDCLFCKEQSAVYERQDFAKGKIIGISSPITASSRFLNNQVAVASMEDIFNLSTTEAQQKQIANGVVTYNSNMLTKIMHAKEEHIIKFLADYKQIVKEDVYIDNAPENFLYDEQAGFTFIDIGETSYPKDPNLVTDEEIFKQFCSIFTLPNCMQEYLNDTQKTILTQKAGEFIDKAGTLAEQSGYNLNLAPEE